jgi:hypothetical protein
MVSIRNTNPTYLNRIAEVARKIGFNPCICRGGAVVINSKQLYKYVEQFGHCRDKFVPKDVKNLPAPYLEAFLNAFILGDGHIFSSGLVRGSSFSEQLIDDLQEVCVKIGMVTRKSVKITGEGSYAKKQPNYIFSAHRRWVHPEIRHVDLDKYNGMVYDCTVPNSIILVRRNGMPVWSGNCLGGKWGDQEGYLGGEIVQPGVYDNGHLPDDLVGYASRAVPVEIGADNLVDACIFDPSVEVSREILDLSLPLYPTLVEPYAGLGVVKSGRTTGVLHGKVTVVDATVDVSGWGTARFVDQVMVEPSIMDGGDSGSIVLSEDGKVAGLGFAGSDKVSVFNKASNVQNLLDIRILGAPFYGVAPPMPSGMGAIAIGVGVFLFGVM